MKPARLNALTPTALAFTFVATTLSAQDVIELPGRDQRIDPDFEEVFRVGVLDGESWEMFGRVGGRLTANIPAGDHVSLTGAARSATPAGVLDTTGSCPNSGKTGVNRRESG